MNSISSVLASIKRLEAGAEMDVCRKGYHLGYGINTDGVQGIALLSSRQLGFYLVTRIKDAEPFLWDEARFWGSQLAKLVADMQFDAVSHPPSSRKRSEHLATFFARQVAEETGIPYNELFTNATPRGTRASTISKLKEVKEYGYERKPTGAKILVVDDVLHTRSTAKACLSACGGDQLFFLILYLA